MCTLAFALNVHPNFPFVFIGNRDEFFSRPTLNASYWASKPSIYGGIDLEKGGTWTAVNQNGKLAFLTNYRDFSRHVDKPISRGELTKDYLTQNIDTVAYLEKIRNQKDNYNPFNLIIGTTEALYYYSNIQDEIIRIGDGIHGLSNALLDSPWWKVESLKAQLDHQIQKHFNENTLDENALLSLLESKDIEPNHKLPSTGISEELEKKLSSVFIEHDEYGTRYETLICIDKQLNLKFIEKARNQDGKWSVTSESIKLK